MLGNCGWQSSSLTTWQLSCEHNTPATSPWSNKEGNCCGRGVDVWYLDICTCNTFSFTSATVILLHQTKKEKEIDISATTQRWHLMLSPVADPPSQRGQKSRQEEKEKFGEIWERWLIQHIMANNLCIYFVLLVSTRYPRSFGIFL